MKYLLRWKWLVTGLGASVGLALLAFAIIGHSVARGAEPSNVGHQRHVEAAILPGLPAIVPASARSRAPEADQNDPYQEVSLIFPPAGTDTVALQKFQFDPYIHRVNGGTADPINLIFLGMGERAAARIAVHVLNWSIADSSPMNFLDNGQTNPTDTQLTYDLPGGRFHIRFETLTPKHGHPYVLAAVHYDTDVACGHAGGRFDEARDRVAHAFELTGYSVTSTWLGNTAPGPQCNGSFTAGDGYADMIQLGGPQNPANPPTSIVDR